MLRNKCIITFVVLLSLVLSACQPIQPITGAPQRTVKGDLYFMVPEWGDIAISIHVDVHEVNPTTHAARGPVNWSIYSFTPQDGGNWRVLESQAKYAIFGAEIPGAETDTVVLITQITAKRGWGQGEPGEYAYFWFKDSGQPEGKGDQWGDVVYKLDPWTEFFPENDPPSVANYITVEQMKQSSSNLPITIEMGDVQITEGAETKSETVPGISGDADFAVPDWGLQHGWFHFNVALPEGEGTAPTGWVRWVEVNANDELRYVMAEPRCLTFSPDGNSALLTLQITNRRGWGDGQAGQFVNLWLQDGGSPGEGKDAFATPIWPPQDADPGCSYVTPEVNIITMTGGDLVIQR